MVLLTDLNTVCDGHAHELLTVCEGPEHPDENGMLIAAVSRALHGAHYFIYTEECLLYTNIHFMLLYYVYFNPYLPTTYNAQTC